MAEKSFGIKELNLIGASGTPSIDSPNNLNLNAVNVAISTNVSIGGTLSVTGNVSIGGTLTYEDVTNIDSVGIITAREGIKIPDSKIARFGTDNDASIYHNGLHLFIKEEDSGQIFIDGANGVSIIGNGATRIATQSDGAFVTGNLGVSNKITAANINIGSNIQLGNAGVVTATTFSGSGASLTNLPASNLTGTLPAISGANLTNLSAANLTGTLPAISGANLTNLPTTDPANTDVQVVYTVTANGTSAYRFAGNGIVSTEDNPDVYLIRGQKYRFINNSGGSHPFQIREASGGTAYSTGVTNNGASSGNIDFAPTYDSPAQLVYQCTSHGSMVGNIYLRDAAGNNTNVGVTTFAGAIDLNADLDVDGHTNLDNVSIAGVTTISNDLTVTSSSPKINLVDSNGAPDYSIHCEGGQLRFAETGGTVRLRINSDGHVDVTDNLDVVKDLDVDGHTNLDNVSISGVSTVAGNCSFAGGNVTMTASGSPNSLNVSGTSRFEIASMENAVLDGEIAHTGDTDTKISFDTNTINLHAGGTTGLTVLDASVRVPTKLGINGAAPQVPLDVIANGSGYAMVIRGRSSDNTAELRFTSNDYGSLYGTIIGGPTYLKFATAGTERLRIGSSGQIGIAGANYGTSGQVLTSQGSGSAVAWSTITETTINNNANNRVITGSGTANTLEGEANLTFTGSILTVTNSSGAAELTLVTPSANDSGVYFNDGSNAGAVSYNHSDNSMRFRVNSTEKVRITNAGAVVTGGTTAQASDAVTLMPDGEVTAAGFYFSNNIGSPMNSDGIRRHTTGTICIDTGSQERVRITSAGNVGINHSNPRGQFVINSTKNALINANCNDPHHFHLSLKNEDENNTAIGLCFSHDATIDRVGAAIIHQRSGNGSVGDMRFYTCATEGTTSERVRISSEGILTKLIHPSFYARRSTGGDGRSSASPVTEWANPGSETSGTPTHNRGGHFNYTTGLFTAPVNGIYHFSAAAGYKQTNNSFNQKFMINGASVLEGCRFIGSPPNSHSTSTASATVYMAAGDTMGVAIETTHHVNTTFNFFCGHLVG